MFWLTAVEAVIIFLSSCEGLKQTKEDEARVYLAHLDQKYCERVFEKEITYFNYKTNITNETYEIMNAADAKPYLDPEDIVYFNWDSFNNSYLKRQAKLYTLLDHPIDPTLLKEHSDVINKMIDALTVGTKLCEYKKPTSCGYDGYAEAVAGTMSVPFTSFKHLQKLGLLDECDKDYEVEINNFYVQFLSTIALLPIVLVNDLWRYKLFRNEVAEANYNQAFWDLRFQYQGVVPPSKRSEEYLDAAVKLQLLDDTPTISYLLMNIITFKYLETLCTVAGEYDPKRPDANPLQNCNLYGNKKVGKIWNKMLKIGASKSWTSSLKAVTGQTRLDAKSVLTYFDPFYKWLVDENKKNKEFIGWE